MSKDSIAILESFDAFALMNCAKMFTAKKDVSFQIALSKLLFALLPRNMGFVRSVSNRFKSSNTLFTPVVSAL